jgi:exopolysaccharide biosynthesis polyprenyl glycosylphosphotransferase
MSRDKDFFILWIHKLMDICLTAAAFITAYFIKLDLLPKPFRGLTTVPNYYTVLLMIIIIWYVTFNLFDLYSDYRRQSLGQIIWEMFKAVSTGMLILMFCMYIFKITDVSRIMMGIFYLLNIGLLTASRGLVLAILVRFRGRNCHNILVVGTRETAKEIIETIEGHQEAGCKVIGCLGFDEEEKGGLVKNGIRVVNTVDSLEKILLNEVVDELIFTVPLSEINEADGYIALAEEIGISVRILPDWHLQKLGYRPKIATLQLEEFFGVTTLALRTTSLKSVDLFIKSLLDYVLATVLLILFLPFLPLIALAIKYLDSGPVFFKQVRSGLNGRRFMFYKFRTMVKDAEDKRKDLEALNEADGPVFKIKSDPRIIKYIGTVLRRTALDELPQLINVLKGEMSLVGPRPPIPAEVEKYD